MWKLFANLLACACLAACSPLGALSSASPDEHRRALTGIAYGEETRQRLDVYLPEPATADAPTVVFFYGGGWRNGDRGKYAFVASSLTALGYVVVIPDYRVYPEVRFPAFVEDAAAAVAWAAEHAHNHGSSPDQVFLAGHSAGAHLAALLALDPSYLDAHGIDADALPGWIGLSGPYDFLPLSGYLADVFPKDTRPASQPVNFAHSGAPPALLIHGADDGTVEPRNSRSLAAALEAAGVPVTLRIYEDAGHARTVAALAPPLDFLAESLQDIERFIDAQRPR
ncbi:MAG: alpha/beta hydrolase [Xanthomonadales bacterium]|nr:alpha/beta hydrolase [Xanthomonadales bacterium]